MIPNLIKGLSKGEDGVDLIQLENGCVCCGPSAGSLAPAVRQMCADSIVRGEPFDHVVIELSGVADPEVVTRMLSDDDIEVCVAWGLYGACNDGGARVWRV